MGNKLEFFSIIFVP